MTERTPAAIIADAIFPCMTSPGRAMEGAHAAIGSLESAGFKIVRVTRTKSRPFVIDDADGEEQPR